MEATLSGPRGFYAVSHVTEEPGIAFVLVPILLEHMVVGTAESWDERRNHRVVIYIGVLVRDMFDLMRLKLHVLRKLRGIFSRNTTQLSITELNP